MNGNVKHYFTEGKKNPTGNSDCAYFLAPWEKNLNPNTAYHYLLAQVSLAQVYGVLRATRLLLR